MLKLEQLATEKINPLTRHIDTLNTLELAALINQEDAKVVPAVARELPAIAAAIDVITDRLRRGGRLFYAGAGTSPYLRHCTGAGAGADCRRTGCHVYRPGRS